LLARWTVKRGPDFQRSLDDCEMPQARLLYHVHNFTLALERDPLTFGEAYGDSGCIIEAKDFAEGCLVTVYAVLYEGLVAEMRWVAETPLPADDRTSRARCRDGCSATRTR
jgi:hypothetical protein